MPLHVRRVRAHVSALGMGTVQEFDLQVRFVTMRELEQRHVWRLPEVRDETNSRAEGLRPFAARHVNRPAWQILLFDDRDDDVDTRWLGAAFCGSEARWPLPSKPACVRLLDQVIPVRGDGAATVREGEAESGRNKASHGHPTLVCSKVIGEFHR